MIGRREVIAGLVAGVALSGSVSAATDDLRVALDAAARDPAAGLRALARFDAATLPAAAQLDLLTARAGLAIDVALARRFPAGAPGRSPYRVTARAGAWRSPKPDDSAIDRETALLAADRAAGVVLPRAALDATIAALDGAGDGPAIARQRAALAGLRQVAPRGPGLSRLPGGAALYALYLRRAAGSDIDPTRALVRLVRERDRLLARAYRLFGRIGMRRGTTGARYATLWRDPRWLYPDDAAGRTTAVADLNKEVAAARTRIAAQFGDVPAFALDVSVRSLSAQEITAGRQGYREPPAPGRPGAYVVDLADIRRRPAWTLPSVVAHELLPGHMLQLGIESETPPHPLRIEYAAAFVEGWGIYAETLALYPDPYTELGHVHWLLFRTGRAIVDLRMHLHGWTPEQARAALVAWQGEPAYFAPFDVELERIAIEPGVRAGEALAWLAIADAMRGLTGAARIARHRAILADGRKRTEMIGTT